MPKVTIRYGNIAQGAGNDFKAYTKDMAYVSDLDDLHKNLTFVNYQNPCEPYSVVLDGTCAPVDYSRGTSHFGWWSDSLSDNSGVFPSPLTLELKAEGIYSTNGIKLVFDTGNDVYATHLKIQWYNEDNLVTENEFEPNAAEYFCEHGANNYNRMVITFYSINLPNNRLKLHNIVYGDEVVFAGECIQNVNISQRISPISIELPISTMDFTLCIDDIDKRNLVAKQKVLVYYGDELQCAMVTKSFKRISKTCIRCFCEDYISKMDTVKYMGCFGGGVINATDLSGQPVSWMLPVPLALGDVLEDIFATAQVKYTLDSGIDPYTTFEGFIKTQSCREALQEVLFAIGATVCTANREDVLIKALPKIPSATITRDMIFQGQTVDDDVLPNKIVAGYHRYEWNIKYTPLAVPAESNDWETMFSADESGTGENILITSDVPAMYWTITNGAITAQSASHAIINAEKGCVLKAIKANHTVAFKGISAGGDGEDKRIEDCELITAGNIDKVLQMCYNYFTSIKQTTMKVIAKADAQTHPTYGTFKYGTQTYGASLKKTTNSVTVSLGDCVEFETEYLGNLRGVIISQSYSLTGGRLVKNIEVMGG